LYLLALVNMLPRQYIKYEFESKEQHANRWRLIEARERIVVLNKVKIEKKGVMVTYTDKELNLIKIMGL